MPNRAKQHWDPGRYRRNAGFVAEYGLSLVELLNPQPDERVLDLGCGDGTLTAHLRDGGASVVGVDASTDQVEAARALGMSRFQTMVHILLPRAARIGLPAYSNEVILMLKASALASTITLLELTGMARTIIARTYLPVEIFFAAGMFYLVIAFVLVRGFKLLERWLRVDACQGR